MMRVERAQRADPALDELEHRWWNENASTISRVWEMAPEVSWAVRRGYLERARAFFLRERGQATVLELGCGSGWVGQSIAGPDLRIVGTDFSESQVALARERARRQGVAAHCSYHVASSGQWPDEAQRADGALIHAFLHHLDQPEIDGVLRDLRTRLKPGSRVWIYEPAFLPGPARAPGGAAWLASRPVHALAALLRLGSGALGLRDQATAAAFDGLVQRAAQNEWYLSPKEVPFEQGAFTRTLQGSLAVKSFYWATIYLVGWALEPNLMRAALARRLACATFLPLARLADRFVAARAESLGSALQPPNYGFAVWECEVKA